MLFWKVSFLQFVHVTHFPDAQTDQLSGCQMQLDTNSALLILQVSKELTFTRTAHTKQKWNKSAARFVFTPTACWFHLFLSVSSSLPKSSFFFTPRVQKGAAPMVAAPESKRGQGLSQCAHSPVCCHGGDSHSVVCRWEMTAVWNGNSVLNVSTCLRLCENVLCSRSWGRKQKGSSSRAA